MNFIDYISVTIIFISTMLGFFRGFFQELTSILIWGIGIYILLKYNYLLSVLSIFLNSKILKWIISVFIFFVFILFIKNISDYYIFLAIKYFQISIIDKILGVIFGFFRGVVILCTVLFFLELLTYFPHSNIFKNSLLVPYCNIFIKLCLKYIFKIIFLKQNK